MRCLPLLGVLLASLPRVVRAQEDSVANRFVAEAREGTRRYISRDVAIADGYRRVGPDVPSMGEHWLNIGLILADSVDAAHPPILIYVASPNGPVLAGAAYTRLLAADDSYPDFPVGLHAWHDHSGFLDDEAHSMNHLGHHGGSAPNGLRLGILHCWIWQNNPAGAWSADNWALPFVQVGIRPPPSNEASAARALAVLADSGRYFLDVLAQAGALDSSAMSRVHTALMGAVRELASIPLAAGVELPENQLQQLRSVWRELLPVIESAFPAERTMALRELERTWW